jgi:molecular chaperone DnaK
MTMVASEHDAFLGGHEWDLRLADLLVAPFLGTHGIDLHKDPQYLEHLVRHVSQVKQALGIRSHSAVHLTFGGASETIEVQRGDFERATADLVRRLGSLCDQVLRRSQLSWSQVQQVMLVGGATRMPMIRQLMRERLGRLPSDLVAPDEAVARGAAIYAARARHGKCPPSLRVSSYSTHSLGMEDITELTGKRINKILLPKGTPLPATASSDFAITGNHRSVVLRVLEGENADPDECLTIGRIFLRDLPADYSGDWRVKVTYQYSASGRLKVDVHVRNAHTGISLETVRPGGVSEAHLVRWRPVVNSLAGFAAYREVRAWEQASQAPPPVAVAGLPNSESEGALAFLGRLMPFLMRREKPTQTQRAVGSHSKSAANLPTDKPAA